MKCPRCNVDMKIGQAIKFDQNQENVCVGFGQIKLTADNIELIEVVKCPQCGHSNDLE